MLRGLALGAVMVMLATGNALADQPPIPPPKAGYTMKFGIPKAWTVSQGKRGTTDVTIYTIASVKDAVFVVFPPSNAYGSDVITAVKTFISKALKGVVSRYPRHLRARDTWYGIKHVRQHALIRVPKSRRYGLRVVYGFNVKGTVQIAVAEAKSSRVVRALLNALAPVTMAGSAKATAKP